MSDEWLRIREELYPNEEPSEEGPPLIHAGLSDFVRTILRAVGAMEARYRKVTKGYEFRFPQGHILGWVGADHRFYWTGEAVPAEVREAVVLAESVALYAKFIGYQVEKHPIWTKIPPALTEEERERRERAVKEAWAEARREGEKKLPTKNEIERLRSEAQARKDPAHRLGRWRSGSYPETYEVVQIYEPDKPVQEILARPIWIGGETLTDDLGRVTDFVAFRVEVQEKSGKIFGVDPRAFVLSADGDLLYNGRALRLDLELRAWFEAHPEWPPTEAIARLRGEA